MRELNDFSLEKHEKNIRIERTHTLKTQEMKIFSETRTQNDGIKF